MAEFDVGSSTTTDFRNAIPDFIVSAMSLDKENDIEAETHWYFTNATENFGYYFQIPEINSAANALATWTTGRGIFVRDPLVKAMLDHVTGLGTDTFQEVMWNHEVTKLVVGDAFAEIIWSKDKTTILNLIPISPERVRVVVEKNQIKRYDIWNGQDWRKMKKENILHSMNKRIGDQIHGTSQIDACKWVIDARNEALVDNRKIEHRGMALGIAYYETDNTGKISYANSQIEKAVKNGEMVGLPADTVKIEPFPTKALSDRLSWIQYLENFFYATFGVPRSIATSDGVSEVGGKMGHVIFEPIYTKEQIDLEDDLRKQLKIDIKFNRPPSLGGLVQEEEAKNTGQINLQPNDVAATTTRE